MAVGPAVIVLAVVVLVLLVVSSCGGRGLDFEPERRGGWREAEWRLMEELQHSPAGRTLIDALERRGAAGIANGVPLLAGELESAVSRRTRTLVDRTDPRLLQAADRLDRMPSDLDDEPVAVLMVLIDEWALRLDRADGPGTGRPLVERLRETRRERADAPPRYWLRQNFPLTYAPAQAIADYLL